jgi:hypothetical protein
MERQKLKKKNIESQTFVDMLLMTRIKVSKNITG